MADKGKKILLIAKGIAKDNKTEKIMYANVGIITQYCENTVWSDITDVYIVNTVKITKILNVKDDHDDYINFMCIIII